MHQNVRVHARGVTETSVEMWVEALRDRPAVFFLDYLLPGVEPKQPGVERRLYPYQHGAHERVSEGCQVWGSDAVDLGRMDKCIPDFDGPNHA